MIELFHGHVLDQLAKIPDESVQCVVTSPPYWGLRDYGTPPVPWPKVLYTPMAGLPVDPIGVVPPMEACLGLEPDLNAFIGHLVLVFREIRRVLKKDGVVWVNIGDGYAGSWGSQGREYSGVAVSALSARQVAAATRKKKKTGALDGVPGLKAKDLQGQPWRLAFALQADGWHLRSECIWHKPNPMPESVRDRPTKAHEQLFMFSKSSRYFYDRTAIVENSSVGTNPRISKQAAAERGIDPRDGTGSMPNGWANSPTYHSALPQVRGWDRSRGDGGHGTIHRDSRSHTRDSFARKTKDSDGTHGQKPQFRPDREPLNYSGKRQKRSVWTIPTQGYKGAHFATFPPALVRPCILATSRPGDWVLDPFLGSGTTAAVAIEEGRSAYGIEQSADYLALARQRIGNVTPPLLHT